MFCQKILYVLEIYLLRKDNDFNGSCPWSVRFSVKLDYVSKKKVEFQTILEVS
jgi:hypothetical protein